MHTLKTYRKDKIMGEEHVRMLHDFVNQARGEETGESVSTLMNKMESMVGFLNHIQQAITMMSTELSITRAQMNMIMRMLVSNGIFTEEELNNRYEEEVAKPIKKQFEQLQKENEEKMKVQEAMKNDQDIRNS